MANMGSYLPVMDALNLNLISKNFYENLVPSIFQTEGMRASLYFNESKIMDDFQKK